MQGMKPSVDTAIPFPFSILLRIFYLQAGLESANGCKYKQIQLAVMMM
jgi:hypothetical protein